MWVPGMARTVGAATYGGPNAGAQPPPAVDEGGGRPEEGALEPPRRLRVPHEQVRRAQRERVPRPPHTEAVLREAATSEVLARREQPRLHEVHLRPPVTRPPGHSRDA